MSANRKLSKDEASKMVQCGGFLGRFLGSLFKSGFPLMRNVLKPLAKRILTPLGLAGLPSAADAGKHKKSLRIGDGNINNFKWRTGSCHENN